METPIMFLTDKKPIKYFDSCVTGTEFVWRRIAKSGSHPDKFCTCNARVEIFYRFFIG
jgi:hypothetical protein